MGLETLATPSDDALDSPLRDDGECSALENIADRPDLALEDDARAFPQGGHIRILQDP
jgi:hypothetical protein